MTPEEFHAGIASLSPETRKQFVADLLGACPSNYFFAVSCAGEETGSPCPSVASPEAVWPHVTPAHVLVEPIEGVPTVEIAFKVAWDIEHTVGARFQNWQFIELNGSVRRQ